MNRLAWVVLVAASLALAYAGSLEGADGTFEAGNYFVVLNYPNFSLHAKFKNGTVYEEQYIKVSLVAVEEGVVSAATIGNKFNASMSYSQADIKSNYSVSQFSENVLLSGGTVNATRTVLHSYSILPNGANFTLRFESYDKDGTTTLGENTVAIKADRLKYSAHLSGWNFTAPNHQVRLMIIGAYYSGSYDTPIPTLDQQDWNTSARHLLITWGATGPVLDTLLDTDVWALADDSVANILLAPNPTIDLASNVFGYDYPKYMASTFGYVLPRFSEQLTWDPTLLMSLFSDDPTSRTTNKSNFDRNRNIIIGCVVGGIVLIVLGIVIAALIVKNKNVRDQRSVIHDQSPATLA